VYLPIGLSTAYEVSFQIYVPTGGAAYFNIQEDLAVQVGWAFDMVFGSNGQATLSIDQVDNAFAAYNMDAWNAVKFLMDPVNDRAEIYLNDQYMNNIPFDAQIGGVNFYGFGDGVVAGLYYIDDLLVVETDDVLNGIEEAELALSFGPNPASDFIQLSSNTTEGLVRIMALNGQVVQEIQVSNLESGTRIDLDLDNGIYLVELNTNSARTMRKLVVSH
jgi:hypothetical protein